MTMKRLVLSVFLLLTVGVSSASAQVVRASEIQGRHPTTGANLTVGLSFRQVDPEGVLTRNIGSMVIQTTSGRWWWKATGSGNTGWARLSVCTTGTSTRVLYVNSSSDCAGDADFTWDDTTNTLSATNIVGTYTGTWNGTTLTVAKGGTGATTLTGVLKGNGTSAFTAATAGTDYVSPSSTESLTNKTLDAEGTGNVLTLPFVQPIDLALCQNATPSLLVSTPTANPGVAACVTGTNTQLAVVQFADGANTLSVQGHAWLPLDWSGAIDVRGKWRTSATSGDVVWQVATACVADAETIDPAFNTASTVTETAKGTTLQLNDFTITGLTVTGCAAGEELFVRVFRDPTTGADTLAATAELVSLSLVVRRAL